MANVRLQAIQKSFGSTAVIHGVSLDIASGAFVSLLGASGCGKTTLLRIIAGLETPDRGSIHFSGEDTTDVHVRERGVGFVFQHYALFRHMTVFDNVAFGLRMKPRGQRPSDATIRAKVKELLGLVQLDWVADRFPSQLSGGQRQRIAIARCMVLEPDILLLDEPLGALDLKLRERMKIELKLLQHQFKTTFIYITHDQSEALVMSDRVAVMNRGRFEQIGTPRDLYHAPASAFVAGFVGDSNRWEGRVLGGEGPTTLVETSNGLRLCASSQVPLAPGTPVAVFVRPEAIAVSRRRSGSKDQLPNSLGGVIEGLLFNGANSRFLVRTGTGDLIEVDLPQAGIAADFGSGDPVELAWAAPHTRCFPS